MADVSHVIRYAPNPPYDSIPITPKTWEQVDLIYYSTISGHRYTNSIQLLRPIAWLHKRHMDIIGSKVTLSIPEFGIVSVTASVEAVKPTQVNTHSFDWSKRNREYVIGRFMRYVTDVRTYTFIDSQRRISHINATPNHPFYVKNKHGFVAIGNVSDDDTLVGSFGFGDKHIDGAMHLVCAKDKHSHCGVTFGGVGLPTSVYNLEVYKRHVYLVGLGGIIAHNVCGKKNIDNAINLPEQGPILFSRKAQQEADQYVHTWNKGRITVYRGDSRSPRDINEAGGFHPRELEFEGIENHTSVHGSCSGAISTTCNKKIAEMYAGKGGYVYKIRLNNSQGFRISESGALHFSNEEEILVPGHISQEQIKFRPKYNRFIDFFLRDFWIKL